MYSFSYIIALSSFIVLQSDDYIIIKQPDIVADSKQNSEKTVGGKDLIEVEDKVDCAHYEIKELYKCKTCLKILTEDQRKFHEPSHELEKVKAGVRMKCLTCKKLFFGNPIDYCPKCKGKLKKEVIELEEKKEGDQTRQSSVGTVESDLPTNLVDKKTGRKICTEKKPDNVQENPQIKEQQKEAKKE